MLGVLEPYRGGDDIPLRKPEMVVGRSEKNDVVLRFADVSGKHCRLVLSRGYWYAEDLGSTNGTRVNGFRTQDHRVHPSLRSRKERRPGRNSARLPRQRRFSEIAPRTCRSCQTGQVHAKNLGDSTTAWRDAGRT